jgi:long-chain acyl-CoA synthetase
MAEGFDYGAHGLIASAARPAIPGGPQSVAEMLDPIVLLDPDREALVDRYVRYTFAELDRVTNRAAQALRSLGVRPYDRVAMSLGNYAEIAIMFLAAMKMGAVWVGISRSLTAKERAYILQDSGARLFLGEPKMVKELEGAALAPVVRSIAVEPGSTSCGLRKVLEATPSEARVEVEIDPFAPAAIAYTSGTTGFPKGAVHSQHNLLLPGIVSRVRGEHEVGTRHGAVLPLAILNLMVLGPVLALQRGSAAIAIDKIDPLALADFIRSERVGHFAGVPTILYDLLTHPEVNPSDLSTLVRPLVGGAECPEVVRRAYKERFGSEVTIGYGMTEAPTAVTMTDGEGPLLPGLCGRALPHVEVEILGENEERLAAGEVGEICIAPAPAGPLRGVYTPMLGYWNKPEETRRALASGRFHTGDLGALDEAGRLFIRGRKNDLILRGGANVYPQEVERVIAEDPRVAACAVLGAPDPRLGERVVAVVELKAGARASAEELVVRCHEALARYKVPEKLIFIEAFPRNAMGKIVKRELLSRLGSALRD